MQVDVFPLEALNESLVILLVILQSLLFFAQLFLVDLLELILLKLVLFLQLHHALLHLVVLLLKFLGFLLKFFGILMGRMLIIVLFDKQLLQETDLHLELFVLQPCLLRPFLELVCLLSGLRQLIPQPLYHRGRRLLVD